jgi:hypothetical protein
VSALPASLPAPILLIVFRRTVIRLVEHVMGHRITIVCHVKMEGSLWAEFQKASVSVC